MPFFNDANFDAGFFFTGLGPESFDLSASPSDYIAAVACRIGYGPGGIPTKEKADTIEKILLRGLAAVAMAGLGKPLAIDRWGEGVFVAGPVCVQSPRWTHVVRQARGSRRLYCFILTLGQAFDRLKAKAGLFEAYVLDGLGSEIVERAADRMEQLLRGLAASHELACSRRFSPGYCDWPLAQGQQTLADFLNPAAIGVSVLATGAMIPSKSISVAVVMAQALPLPYPCPVCKQADCPYRRV